MSQKHILVLASLISLAAGQYSGTTTNSSMCCQTKVVGGQVYHLVEEWSKHLEGYGCDTYGDCVYVLNGTSRLFCFRLGGMIVDCDSTTQPPPSTTTPATTTTPPTTSNCPDCYSKLSCFNEYKDAVEKYENNPPVEPCMPKKCMEYNRIYGSEETIAAVVTPDPGACSCICQWTCGCEVFSWYPNFQETEGKCELMPAEAKNNPRKSDRRVSGVMNQCPIM